MIKILFIIILTLIITLITTFIIIKNQTSKKKELQNQLNDCKLKYNELNNKFDKLMEEMEIEKHQNQELTKKLADISHMSINDILSQLQHD